MNLGIVVFTANFKRARAFHRRTVYCNNYFIWCRDAVSRATAAVVAVGRTGNRHNV